MNQNPEQIAYDAIERMLIAAGCQVQFRQKINLTTSTDVAVREYQTNISLANFVLFVDKKPFGTIEAKRAEEGVHLTVHGDQSDGYAKAKLKFLNNEPLPFVYESIDDVIQFIDYQDIYSKVF